MVFEAGFLAYIICGQTKHFASAVESEHRTQQVLDTLKGVIETKDTANRLESTHENAGVVNGLLDLSMIS